MRPNPQFLDAIRANFPVDARLVIGCQMGGRSQTAAEILANAGYHDVANVLGGYGGAPHMGHAGRATNYVYHLARNCGLANA